MTDQTQRQQSKSQGQFQTPTRIISDKPRTAGDLVFGTKSLQQSHDQDVLAARIKVVDNPDVKDPLTFTDKQDQHAAVLARVKRIMDNPKFQQLPTEHKDEVLNNYYDKYVIPSYIDSGFTPPDKQTWVQQIQKSKISAQDYYPDHDTLTYARTYAGVKRAAGEIFGGISQSGIWLHKEAALSQLGLTEIFTAPFVSGGAKSLDESSFKPQREQIEQAHKYASEQVHKISDDMVNSANFFLQSYPSKKLMDKLDSFVGEQILQLPLYEGIGAARKLLVGKGLASLEQVQKANNLTNILKASGAGMSVAKRIGDAFDGLIGATLQGQDNESKKASVAFFVGLGALGEIGKVAGSNLIKKFTSEILAAGGRPLQESVTNEAIHELDNDFIHGQKIESEYSFTHPTEVMKEIGSKHDTRIKDPEGNDAGWIFATEERDGSFRITSHLDEKHQNKGVGTTAYENSINSILAAGKTATSDWDRSPQAEAVWQKLKQKYQVETQAPPGFMRVEGARRPGDNIYVITGKKPVQEQVLEALKNGHEADPVKAKLVDGEKISLSSLAMQKHGKRWNQLSHSQRDAIRVERGNLVNDTIRELPLHQPEMAKANIDQQLAKDIKENPNLARRIQELKQNFGIDASSAVFESEQEATAEVTGQKSSQGSTDKVGKQIEQSTKTKQESQVTAALQEPRKFAQLKEESVAYFRNPSPSKQSKFDYSKWLEDMDRHDFISELRSHLGDQPFFENPEHLLTWAVQFKDQMPKPFYDRIIEELNWSNPTGTAASWQQKARNMERHLDKLADTGRLWSEGNVFRSSNFDNWTNRTQWQRQLNPEVEKKEMDELMQQLGPYKKNYPMQYQLAQDMMKELQKYRRTAPSPEVDATRTQSIRSIAGDIKSLIKGGK
jgi:hypothetical protein